MDHQLHAVWLSHRPPHACWLSHRPHRLPLPPQFGLAWRKGANITLVDAYDKLLLALQEDGTVSQVCVCECVCLTTFCQEDSTVSQVGAAAAARRCAGCASWRQRRAAAKCPPSIQLLSALSGCRSFPALLHIRHARPVAPSPVHTSPGAHDYQSAKE